MDSFSSLYELHEGIPVLLKVLATCILELDQSVEAQREAGRNLLVHTVYCQPRLMQSY